MARRRTLVRSKRGADPHPDDGVEGRRIFHERRSRARANVTGPVTGIVDANGPLPTRGVRNTRRFALGAVLVYHLALLHCSLTARDLRVGLTPLLHAA